MKGRTKKASNTTKVTKKPILIDLRDRDVVFEVVDEASIPQATLNSTRKTPKK